MSVIYLNELEQAEIRFNPVNRCYLCKKALFQRLKDFAAQKGVSLILEGTNEGRFSMYTVRDFRQSGNWGSSVLWQIPALQKKRVRRLAGELGVSVASAAFHSLSGYQVALWC